MLFGCSVLRRLEALDYVFRSVLFVGVDFRLDMVVSLVIGNNNLLDLSNDISHKVEDNQIDFYAITQKDEQNHWFILFCQLGAAEDLNLVKELLAYRYGHQLFSVFQEDPYIV